MDKDLIRRYFPAALILLAGLLAYSNTFTVPFQFDDASYIVNNPAVKEFHFFLSPGEISSGRTLSPTGIPVALRYAFMTRILGYLSLAVNYHLHGLNVIGYHVINLFLHLMNGWLLYIILKETFERIFVPDHESDNSAPGCLALTGTVLFICHPIQTQAVTYISSRFVLLASFFTLLSLTAYIKARFSSHARRAFMAVSMISLCAAMLTKEFTFTTPFIIALYEYSFFKGTLRERAWALGPVFLTLPIIPALVFIQRGSIGALDSTMRIITAADVSQISRVDYLLTQFRVLALYLRLLVLPIGQNIDHDIRVQHSLASPDVVSCFLLLLTMVVVAGYGYYRSFRSARASSLRLFSFGICWFFITLAVESSIIPLGELSAEYRLYLPSVGMVLAFTSAAWAGARRVGLGGRTFYAIVALFALLLCTATVLRNKVWNSEIALWADAARKSPSKVRPHQNLGTYYSMEGRLTEARSELQTAIRLDPLNYELHNNLGTVYRKEGDLGGAMGEYSMALQLEPTDPMAHYNMGNIYLAQGYLSEAIRAYEACLKIAADYDEAHNNLGIAYARNGNLPAAIGELRRAVSLNPNNVNARDNLALFMKQAGMPLSR